MVVVSSTRDRAVQAMRPATRLSLGRFRFEASTTTVAVPSRIRDCGLALRLRLPIQGDEHGQAARRLRCDSTQTPSGSTEACRSLLVWAAHKQFSPPCSLTSR